MVFGRNVSDAGCIWVILMILVLHAVSSPHKPALNPEPQPPATESRIWRQGAIQEPKNPRSGFEAARCVLLFEEPRCFPGLASILRRAFLFRIKSMSVEK